MKLFDMHGDIWTDAAIHRAKGERFAVRDNHRERFRQGDMGGGVFIAWVDPPYDTEDGKGRFWQIVRAMSAELAENKDLLVPVNTVAEFEKVAAAGKLAVVPGVEGLAAVEEDPDWLYVLDRIGFRLASLTWNEQNALATGVRGEDQSRGVTEQGAKFIERMEEIGMLLDVSHLNEASFWDVARLAKKPFIASHSNAKAIRDVPRNLTDAQIDAIGKAGGLIGMNAFHEFVHEDPAKRTLDTLIDHMEHIIDLIGIGGVGLGFDFFEYIDAGSVSAFASEEYVGTKGIEDISKGRELVAKLAERGFGEEDIAKICYKNFFRVLEAVRA